MRKLMAVLAVAGLALASVGAVLAEGPDGKALYDSKCAMCHGKDGVAKAMAKGAGNFNDAAWQKSHSEADLEKVISEGKGKMPKYEGKLKPEEIKAVAAYVKTLGK